MASSVRDPVSAFQVGCTSADFKLNALPQLGVAVGHVLTGQEVFWLAALCLTLFAVLALPAVWSSKPARRKAALAVLDRLIRWRG